MTETAMDALARTDGIALIAGCTDLSELTETLAATRARHNYGAALMLVGDAPLPAGVSLGAEALGTGHQAIILDVDRHSDRLNDALAAAGAGLSLYLVSTKPEPADLVTHIVSATDQSEQAVYRQYFVNRVRMVSAPDASGIRNLHILDARHRDDLDQQEPTTWHAWFSSLRASAA